MKRSQSLCLLAHETRLLSVRTIRFVKRSQAEFYEILHKHVVRETRNTALKLILLEMKSLKNITWNTKDNWVISLIQQ